MSVPALGQQNVYSVLQSKLDASTIKINIFDSKIRKYGEGVRLLSSSARNEILTVFSEAIEALESFETFALQNCLEANSWDITALVIEFKKSVNTGQFSDDPIKYVEKGKIAERIAKLRTHISEKVGKSEHKGLEPEVVALREEVKKQGATIEQLKQDVQLLKMALLAQEGSGGVKRPRPDSSNHN